MLHTPGPGPGLSRAFPPTYVCPPVIGYRWMPSQTVVVVPNPPLQIYVYPEAGVVRSETAERKVSETARAANYSDEVARARRLYPRGIPAVEHGQPGGEERK